MLVPTGRTVTTDFISEWGRVMRKKKNNRYFRFYVESVGLSERSNRVNNIFKRNQKFNKH